MVAISYQLPPLNSWLYIYIRYKGFVYQKKARKHPKMMEDFFFWENLLSNNFNAFLFDLRNLFPILLATHVTFIISTFYRCILHGQIFPVSMFQFYLYIWFKHKFVSLNMLDGFVKYWKGAG
jgi:hypothetical protein